jgi:predicted nucleic acid-binding protein
MKIVVDSNIVFSAILNSDGNIGQLILEGSEYFDFFSIGLLKGEILNHKKKILQIGNFSEEQFAKIYLLVLSKITFIEDIVLNTSDLISAFELVKDIDENDAMFVALNTYLNAKLWTGDKKLIAGLSRKNYLNTITTNELYKNYLELKSKSLK